MVRFSALTIYNYFYTKKNLFWFLITLSISYFEIIQYWYVVWRMCKFIVIMFNVDVTNDVNKTHIVVAKDYNAFKFAFQLATY